MPRPIIGIDKISFQLDTLENFQVFGFNLKPNGDVPDVVKLRSKRHYWKNVDVVDDASSTNTYLHLKGKPKRKNGAAAAAAAVAVGAYDGTDDLTITLTWGEGTGDEQTETLYYEEIVITDPPPPGP